MLLKPGVIAMDVTWEVVSVAAFETPLYDAWMPAVPGASTVVASPLDPDALLTSAIELLRLVHVAHVVRF